MNKKVLRFFTIFLFVVIIFLPIPLGKICYVLKYDLETTLHGFTKEINKPENYNIDNIFSGKFQKDFKNWLDKRIPLNSYFIKTYNTIRFYAFKNANSDEVIAKRNFIYEKGYLQSKLALMDRENFAIKRNQENLKKYVNDLITLQEKLQKVGKNLYVYIVPSKISLYPETMPQKFIDIAEKNPIDPPTYFKKVVKDTKLNYWFASSLAKDIKYPLFYSTSSHWSRIYENLVTNKIITDIEKLTGKTYRKLKLGKVKKSKNCYWRDCDLSDLLNIWTKFPNTYYRYEIKRETPSKFTNMRFLIMGDSFADGLRKDIKDTYNDEGIYYVSRNNYIIEPSGNAISLDGNYKNVDFKKYLDDADVVIIEMVGNAGIPEYSYGFPRHLINILDGKIDYDKTKNFTKNNKTNNKLEKLNIQKSYGIYPQEKRFTWAEDYFSFQIQDNEISSKGLEFSIRIPTTIIRKFKKDTIIIYVNKEKVFEETFTKDGKETIYIPANKFKKSKNNIYEITFDCSNYMIPNKDRKNSKDKRRLGLKLNYIGAKR